MISLFEFSTLNLKPVITTETFLTYHKRVNNSLNYKPGIKFIFINYFLLNFHSLKVTLYNKIKLCSLKNLIKLDTGRCRLLEHVLIDQKSRCLKNFNDMQKHSKTQTGMAIFMK